MEITRPCGIANSGGGGLAASCCYQIDRTRQVEVHWDLIGSDSTDHRTQVEHVTWC
jgi:hypothetical protein